jgi:hypothetical protein
MANVPVNGSMDDPKFRVGPIVWQALINVLTKIVTAPFAALGRLFAMARSSPISTFPRAPRVWRPSSRRSSPSWQKQCRRVHS